MLPTTFMNYVHEVKMYTCNALCTWGVGKGMLLTNTLNYVHEISTRWPLYRSGKGYADDYYLDAKSQCAGGRGACPDR